MAIALQRKDVRDSFNRQNLARFCRPTQKRNDKVNMLIIFQFYTQTGTTANILDSGQAWWRTQSQIAWNIMEPMEQAGNIRRWPCES